MCLFYMLIVKFVYTVKIKVEELIEGLAENDSALQPPPDEKSSDNQCNEGQQEITCSSSGQNGAREYLFPLYLKILMFNASSY